MNPAFPRSTAWWWFGCKKAPRGTVGNELSRNQLTLDDTDDVAERYKPLQHQDVIDEYDSSDDSGET